jgi:UDP-GlcNAc:undecaprenyl-phosphate GlcNAc-1-phosphate transferase
MAAAFAAAALSLLVTPLVLWGARRFSLLDHPDGYKAHRRPTPLLGGLAVALATLGGAFFFLPRDDGPGRAGLAALAVGGAVILAAGLLDDTRGLAPRRKFAWQLGATTVAGLCLVLLGVRLHFFLVWPQLPVIVMTIVWIVGITNAVNFLDNMNGLCAGLGAAAAATLSAVNMRTEEPAVAVVAAALAGACVGFLPYNWPRARIFLGDTGSMFIGFSLAALSVMGVYTRGANLPIVAVYSPLIVLAVPVLDLLIVLVLRARAGHPFWIGDRRHVSHRLVRRGMTPTVAVVILWASGAACGIAAYTLPTMSVAGALVLLLALAAVLALLMLAAGSEGLEE